MKLKPLGDRILVKALQEDEKTKSGIIIPDNAKEKPMQGEVVAVGTGKTLEDGKVIQMDVKVGDKVMFGKYSGTDIKVEGEELTIMHHDDVIGILE